MSPASDGALAALFRKVRALTRIFGVELSRYRPPVTVSGAETLYAPADWCDMVCAWCDGFAGKRIVEVGCDVNGTFVNQLARLYRPAEIVGINPVVQLRQFSEICRMEKGDIRSTTFADHYFDVILSSSAFEHIQNFDVALTEMYRILRPGGYLFSHFGPIWSTSYGHHLWLSHNNELYTYWNVALPPYCHLLHTPSEIAALLSAEYSPDVCKAIGEYVCNSGDQNQLFFEDYERIIKESPFRTLLFKGYDHPELGARYGRQMTPELFRLLHGRLPGRNFSYDGITVLLQKPDHG